MPFAKQEIALTDAKSLTVFLGEFENELRRAALATQPSTLTWDEVSRFHHTSDVLYDLCCDRLCGGTRDPRLKPRDLLEVLHNVRSSVFGKSVGKGKGKG